MSATADAALTYAALGWPVIALHHWTGTACSCPNPRDCNSPAKHPRPRHGLTEATTDTDIIRAWWAKWPDANLGLLTGVNFDVLDVDGDDGIDALMAHAVDDPGVEGPMASTGRGYHLLFQPTGEGNRTRIVEHVDWRGKGGYIVAPPSVHATGRVYQWLPGAGPDVPVQHIPPWLAALVIKPAPPVRAMPARSTDGNAWAQRALESEVGRLAMAVEGTRNDALNRAAFNLGQIVAGGDLEAGEVVACLLSVAERIGLGTKEAEDTIRSGLSEGLRTPRCRPA